MLMVDGELHTKMRRFPMVIRGNIRMVRTWQLDDYSSKNTLIRCHRCHLQHLITESAQGDALQRYHFKHVFHITATFVLLFQTLPSKPTLSKDLRRVPYCRRCGDRWMPLKKNGRRSYSVAMMSTGSTCLPGHPGTLPTPQQAASKLPHGVRKCPQIVWELQVYPWPRWQKWR